ncbi:MAG: hypothetical protein IJH37_08560 [Clostridia bacterium]|nr:hypothetical protein [Clostridia bacterium]
MQNNIFTPGGDIKIAACVHRIKRAGAVTLITLRAGGRLIQAAHTDADCAAPRAALKPGAYISLTGTVRHEPRAPRGIEITLKDFTVLAAPCSDDDTAPLHPILMLRAAAADAFRATLAKDGFFEMHSPAVRRTEDGDTGLFRLSWFGADAVLTGDPRRYLIDGAAALDRVLEISQAFSAARHNSPRHLAEYTRLDFEMNYINGIADVMAVSENAINAIITRLSEDCAEELAALDAALPEAGAIPVITFTEAMAVLGKSGDQPDLDPTDEARLSSYAQKSLGSELLFVTRLPSEKRPQREAAASEAGLSEGFILLCRGMEVASGGEHSSPSMPRHGGCGIGLERLLMKLLQLPDIRDAAPFPRDMHNI